MNGFRVIVKALLTCLWLWVYRSFILHQKIWSTFKKKLAFLTEYSCYYTDVSPVNIFDGLNYNKPFLFFPKVLWSKKYFRKLIQQMLLLKGQCHEIFDIFLFHESKLSGPLINRQKWLCLKVRFRGEIREKFDSQSPTPRRLTLRGVENWNVRKSKIG